MTEADDILAEADAESKVGGAEIQDSNAEFGTNDRSAHRDMRQPHHTSLIYRLTTPICTNAYQETCRS
jgi:hypothetical protein